MTRLAELTQKVDGFFARVEARHGTDMQCSTGCSDCCHVNLTITRVEATEIRRLVGDWSHAARHALADVRPPSGRTDRCAALDAAGRCKIYDARPLVCRSHGVPIRLRQGRLPVVQSCHHNFKSTTPDADCVLDQTTLSAMLLAIDRAALPLGSAADSAQVPAGDRATPAPASDPAGLPDRAGAEGRASDRVELAVLLAELAAI